GRPRRVARDLDAPGPRSHRGPPRPRPRRARASAALAVPGPGEPRGGVPDGRARGHVPDLGRSRTPSARPRGGGVRPAPRARGAGGPGGVRRRTAAWRRIVADALGAAAAVVRRLAPAAGQRVVGGREAGYRGWDPEVIGVDTAAERAVMRVLRRAGVRGRLLSEEAGEVPLDGMRGASSEPVYVVMDPFDGSMLYRRGIRAHWFTALGIYGEDGLAQAAGLVDHVTGERVVADRAGASRTRRPGARPEAVRPSRTRTLETAYVEAYLMK